VGYHFNRLDEPVFIAVSKPLLTEFGIDHIGVRGVFLQGGNLQIYLIIYPKNEACRGVCWGIPPPRTPMIDHRLESCAGLLKP